MSAFPVENTISYSVTVTFNSSVDSLSRQVDMVRSQVDTVIIVDNGSVNIKEIKNFLNDDPGLILIANDRNRGMATALNQGITVAVEGGADFVLLLDQDSLPERDYLRVLLKTYVGAVDKYPKIAAIAGQQEDMYTGKLVPFAKVGFCSVRGAHPDPSLPECCICDYLITSGTLLNVRWLPVIGEMENGLFIDNVDIEWCFRAIGKSFTLLGCFSTSYRHRLGSDFIPIFGGIGLRKCSPERVYYATRNSLLLYKRSYVPMAWCFYDLTRTTIKKIMLLLLSKPRFPYVRAVVRGIMDARRY